MHINNFNWETLDKLRREDINEQLDNFFTSIGSKEFRSVDKEAMQYQLTEAKKLKKEIQKHQKIKYTNVDKYLNSTSILSTKLSDMDYKTNSDLAQVYYEYFQTILSYIYDLFNTQHLENEKKHIIEIDKILVTQLLKIANVYIQKMEDYLK